MIYNNNLILTCLDVGHGQVILTELPGNENILFDAGSLSKSNIGNKVVTGFLDYKGITKIDDPLAILNKNIDKIRKSYGKGGQDDERQQEVYKKFIAEGNENDITNGSNNKT